jgi:hypothetical protein
MFLALEGFEGFMFSNLRGGLVLNGIEGIEAI